MFSCLLAFLEVVMVNTHSGAIFRYKRSFAFLDSLFGDSIDVSAALYYRRLTFLVSCTLDFEDFVAGG